MRLMRVLDCFDKELFCNSLIQAGEGVVMVQKIPISWTMINFLVVSMKGKTAVVKVRTGSIVLNKWFIWARSDAT